ncbi:SRPBCC family protein [Natronorubrum aibiense]|uniref:SRPBCC family protein n=1 Tax=Natronorubrum aibiense TaxID=348826 RepID=A0A5P9P9F9_9EURY|nr:SRPBCC family protein [Natronorubrum aibiense]QFU84748.1 SRPBCC family protein [Natronorubrum aibiense]
METVSMSRRFNTDPNTLQALITDVEPFMYGAGFDRVDRTGSVLELENSVGLATITLELELVDEPDAVLAYEHREGIFDQMTTRYELDTYGNHTELTATTAFELEMALVGMILDATVIKRQRRKELAAQFDYLAEKI